jgi:hypothetical protein
VLERERAAGGLLREGPLSRLELGGGCCGCRQRFAWSEDVLPADEWLEFCRLLAEAPSPLPPPASRSCSQGRGGTAKPAAAAAAPLSSLRLFLAPDGGHRGGPSAPGDDGRRLLLLLQCFAPRSLEICLPASSSGSVSSSGLGRVLERIRADSGPAAGSLRELVLEGSSAAAPASPGSPRALDSLAEPDAARALSDLLSLPPSPSVQSPPGPEEAQAAATTMAGGGASLRRLALVGVTFASIGDWNLLMRAAERSEVLEHLRLDRVHGYGGDLGGGGDGGDTAAGGLRAGGGPRRRARLDATAADRRVDDLSQLLAFNALRRVCSEAILERYGPPTHTARRGLRLVRQRYLLRLVDAAALVLRQWHLREMRGGGGGDKGEARGAPASAPPADSAPPGPARPGLADPGTRGRRTGEGVGGRGEGSPCK